MVHKLVLKSFASITFPLRQHVSILIVFCLAIGVFSWTAFAWLEPTKQDSDKSQPMKEISHTAWDIPILVVKVVEDRLQKTVLPEI